MRVSYSPANTAVHASSPTYQRSNVSCLASKQQASQISTSSFNSSAQLVLLNSFKAQHKQPHSLAWTSNVSCLASEQ
jgi:hypothetical protein